MSTEVSPGEPMEAAAPIPEQSQDAQTAQQPEAEKMVPLSALEAERAHRQRHADENAMMKEHLNLLQARQQMAPQQPPQETVSPDDVMTFGEFDKRAAHFEQKMKATIGEMQISKAHPDYDEVIRKYLPEIIKEDPDIGQTLQSTQNYKLAYKLAKSSDAYRRDHAEQKRSADANRLVANSERPGSLSSVGGTTPISMAKRYKDMSDTEFMAQVAKNVGHA